MLSVAVGYGYMIFKFLYCLGLNLGVRMFFFPS